MGLTSCTNENSDHGNQKAAHDNVVSFLNKNHLYNGSLFLVSHCYGSVEPIYIKKSFLG